MSEGQQIHIPGGDGAGADATSKHFLEASIFGAIFGAVGFWTVLTVLPDTFKAYFKRGELPYAANYLLLLMSATTPGVVLEIAMNPRTDGFTKFFMLVTIGLCCLIAGRVLAWVGNMLIKNGLTWAPGAGALRRRLGIEFSLRDKLAGSGNGIGAWLARVFAPAQSANPAQGSGLNASLAALPAILREGENYVRGAKVVQPQALSNCVAAAYQPRELPLLIQIGGVFVPHHIEPLMWVIAGRTGSGKSQVYYNFLQAARKRGNPAMVADSDAGFYSRFGREGDLIFNPFDKRSVQWSPFLDLKEDSDCERLAKAVIPDGNDEKSKVWSGYAQLLFGDVLRTLWKRGDYSVKQLCYYILTADREELAGIIEGQPSAILVQDGNEEFLGSARGSALPALAAWRYMPDKGNFSVRQWVRDNADAVNGPWLFVTHRPDQMAALRTLVAAVFELAMIETLTLTDSDTRRLWFFFDEMDRMGKIQSAELFATNARKKGGCFVGGVQNYEQLQTTYGQGPAQTLLSCLSSKIIMAQGNAASAKYWSGEIGDQDIERWEASTGNNSSNSIGGGGMNFGRNTSQAQRTVTQPAVMASDLQALPNLQGYLKLAECPTAPFAQTHQKIAQINEAYLPLGA